LPRGIYVVGAILIAGYVVYWLGGVLQELPKQLADLWAKVGPWLEQRGVAIPHSTTEWIERLYAHASAVASSILAPAGNFLSTLMGGTLSVIGSFVAALVVLVLAIYLLNDFDRMTAGIRELIPLRWRATVVSYAEEIDQILSQFLRG
jgi:predicted PurR-regulated permease PerM